MQLKDKWRNLIKFQHLRRGEAESAPYKTGARGSRARGARKRKSANEVDRCATRRDADDASGEQGGGACARAARSNATRARGTLGFPPPTTVGPNPGARGRCENRRSARALFLHPSRFPNFSPSSSPETHPLPLLLPVPHEQHPLTSKARRR